MAEQRVLVTLPDSSKGSFATLVDGDTLIVGAGIKAAPTYGLQLTAGDTSSGIVGVTGDLLHLRQGAVASGDASFVVELGGGSYASIEWDDTNSLWRFWNGAAWQPMAGVAGSDTQVQYNDGGSAVGASADLTFDKTAVTLSVGQPTVFPDNPVAVAGNVDSYLQVNMQNKSAGNDASTDFVVTNDLGDDGSNYLDLGVNSSTYNNPAYSISGAGAGYLYASNGDLTIGTAAATRLVKFHTSGTTSAELRATIDDDGVLVPATLNFRKGSDILPILTSSNPENVGTAAAVGTATDAAHADHVHALPWSATAAALGTQAGTNVGWIFKSDGAGSGTMGPNVHIIQRYLTVGITGDDVDYTSIKDAVDAAIAGGAGEATPWVILVYPGTYTEDPMTIVTGISLSQHHANRMDEVYVVASDPNEDLFTCTGGYIGGLRVSGVTDVAKACFRMATASTQTVLHGVSIRACSTGIAVSNGAACILTNFSVSLTGASQSVTTAILVTGVGSYLGWVGGYLSVPSALLPAYTNNPVQTGVRVADQARVYLVGVAFKLAYKDTTADGLLADGGSISTVLSCEATGCANGVHIGASGTGTKIIIQGANFLDNYLNGKVESSTGEIYVAAACGEVKLDAVAGALLSGIIQTTVSQTTFLAGAIEYLYPTSKAVEIPEYLNEWSSTGLAYGGTVTDAGGLAVDVAAGEGYCWRGTPDHDLENVSWDAETSLALTGSATNYIVYDPVTPGIISQTSPPGEAQVLLATVVTDGSGIRFLHKTRTVIYDPATSLQTYLLVTRKFAVASGMSTSAGTTVTRIDMASGSYYRAKDLITYAGSGGDATFSYFYGTNGATEVASQTDVSTTQYDNAGTLTAMTAGYWRSDTVYVTSDGRVSVIYGTAEYATQALAEAALLGNVPTFMEETACASSRLLVQQGNGITLIVDERPFPAQGGAGGTGGVSVHGALAGLSADDHTQYLLVAGTRAMSGNLAMGGNNITGVGTVDGVTVSAHASRHNPGGADALAYGVPVAVQVGAAASAGTGSSYALNDHQHGIAAGSPVSVGTANADGTASSTSRSDHVHSGLTRGANDFTVFANKPAPLASADVFLIEDSAAAGVKKNVLFSAISGSTLATAQARRTTTYAMTVAWADISFDTTDVETNNLVIDHDATTPDRIIVKEAGTYLVCYQFEVQTTATGKFEGRVRVNDTTVLAGSTQGSITYTAESDILSIVAVANLAANDFLTVQAQVAMGGTMSTNATFSVFRMNGLKGDTGSGSTVTVQDEGVPVTATPHSTLNFTGAGVQATNAGGGVCNITIPGGALFGSEYQDATNGTFATVTGTTWTTHLTMTTPALPAGRYRVGWYYEWAHNSLTTSFRGRVQVDGVTDLMNQVQEPKDTAITQRQPVGGFAYVNLSAAAHAITVQFSASAAGSTARMQMSSLEIWRIS
jgi:hypothetical protein